MAKCKCSIEPLKPKRLHDTERVKDIVVKMVELFEAGVFVPEHYFDELYAIIRG